MLINKNIYLFVLLLGFIGSFGKSNSQQSLLWEISGNDLKEPSFLYGTMHVSKKIAFHLSDSFFIAIDNADLIALESDPGKWMKEMFSSKSALAMSGYSNYLKFNHGKHFYESISNIESPDNKKLIAALRNKHALQNGFLYRGSVFNDEYEENTYLDLFIYQYARKNNKQVLNLEEHKETNILRVKSMIPDKFDSEEEKKQRRKKTKSYHSQWNEKTTVKEALENAYRDGHINTLDSIMKLTAYSENYLECFLYQRNKIMANRMDSLMKTNKLFVGIGAAHLAGEQGVIQLLKNMGYRMRPVTKKISKLAKSKKEIIEETFLPIPFQKQVTKDGYISLNLPGELFETPGENGDIQYFYPEMINGGYFFIRRFNTFSPIHDRSPGYWRAKVDSLLFENIEGKIIDEHSTTINGFPAKDVLNKTRKGDFQRRLVVFTPLEIIFFKMSGPGLWVKTNGDLFFNSIHLNKNTLKKGTYTSHLSNYQVTFPQAPIHNVHAEHLYEAPRHCIQSYSMKDSSYFLLFSGHLNDTRYIEEDSFEVKLLIKTFFEQLDSTKIESLQYNSVHHKSASGKVKYKEKWIHVKSMLHKNFYYVLAAKGNHKQAMNFFDSFQWKDTIIENPYALYKDTLLNYSVTTPVVPEKMEDLLLSVQELRKQEDKNTWNSNKAIREFKYDKTKENIEVHYYRYSDYFHVKNYAAYWKNELKRYRKNGLKIVHQTINNDSIPFCNLILADTNSSKVIRVKKLLNQRTLYTLKSSYDSLNGPSNFVQTFFETFSPQKNSANERSILRNSANLFFTDLKSKDSLRVKKATELVNKITFEKEHIDSIIWFIENYEFPKEDENATKIYLIRELGYIKSPLAIDYLSKKFINSEDNYKVQFAALKGLAKIGTKKSYKVLTNLITSSPPIVPSKSTIKHLFNYFDDSLEISKKIYPKVWDLMLYNNYRPSIYKLSATMLDSGLIKPNSYKKFKPLILREAKRLLQKKSKYNNRVKLEGTSYFYKHGNRIDHQILFVDQFKVTKLLKLLVPYYQKDRSVTQFFDRIFKSTNDKSRYIASVLFLKNNLAVPDSIVKTLLNSPTYHYPFYRDVKLSGNDDILDNYVISDDKIAKSIIYAGSSTLEPKEDSILLVKKVAFKEKGKERSIFFFKSESDYETKWKIHYTTLPYSKEKNFNLDFDFIDRNITVYSEKEIEKEIKKIIKELSLRNKKRAKKQR